VNPYLWGAVVGVVVMAAAWAVGHRSTLRGWMAPDRGLSLEERARRDRAWAEIRAALEAEDVRRGVRTVEVWICECGHTERVHAMPVGGPLHPAEVADLPTYPCEIPDCPCLDLRPVR
jgi:hypothetical protein